MHFRCTSSGKCIMKVHMQPNFKFNVKILIFIQLLACLHHNLNNCQNHSLFVKQIFGHKRNCFLILLSDVVTIFFKLWFLELTEFMVWNMYRVYAMHLVVFKCCGNNLVSLCRIIHGILFLLIFSIFHLTKRLNQISGTSSRFKIITEYRIKYLYNFQGGRGVG